MLKTSCHVIWNIVYLHFMKGERYKNVLRLDARGMDPPPHSSNFLFEAAVSKKQQVNFKYALGAVSHELGYGSFRLNGGHRREPLKCWTLAKC